MLASQQRLLTNNGCLLRSKGFAWLPSCPGRVVEWSSSGLLLEVALTHPWFCEVPEVSRTDFDIFSKLFFWQAYRVQGNQGMLPVGNSRQTLPVGGLVCHGAGGEACTAADPVQVGECVKEIGAGSGLLLEVAVTHPWFCEVPEVRQNPKTCKCSQQS